MPVSPLLLMKPPCTSDRWSLYRRTKADALLCYTLLLAATQSIFHDSSLPSGRSCNHSLTEEIQHKIWIVCRPQRATAEMDLAANYCCFLFFPRIMLVTKSMIKV